mmetsp:Transcript_31341/g.56800  ORF Transcript_31341/g.56800 Transcript_31341/m.56800 type:complete len:117 (+) Transcript_31341:133-483(+)
MVLECSNDGKTSDASFGAKAKWMHNPFFKTMGMSPREDSCDFVWFRGDLCAFESCIRWHSLLVVSVTCMFEGSVLFSTFSLTLLVSFHRFFYDDSYTTCLWICCTPHPSKKLARTN